MNKSPLSPLPSLVAAAALAAAAARGGTIRSEAPAAVPFSPDWRVETAWRGIGAVSAERTPAPDGGSVTRYECESPAAAALLASKRKADLLGFAVPETLRRYALRVDGSALVERYAPGGVEGGGTAHGAAADGIDETAHPAWMDCFDGYGAALWERNGGMQTIEDADFAWVKSLGITFAASNPKASGLYLSPGVLDDTVTGYLDAMAERHGLPYRRMLHGSSLYDRSVWNLPEAGGLPYAAPVDGFHPWTPYFGLTQDTAANRFVRNDAISPYADDLLYRMALDGAAKGWTIGWHGAEETPAVSLQTLEAVAGRPEVRAAWRKKHPDGGDVPHVRDFIGWNPETDLDLRGEWTLALTNGATARVRSDDVAITLFCNRKISGNAANALKDFHPRTRLSRTFEVEPGRGGAACRYLHLARTGAVPNHLPSGTTDVKVWANGREGAVVPCRFEYCFDLGDAVREGENEIVVETEGRAIHGYIVLNGTRVADFPGMAPELNARWRDAIEFIADLCAEKVERDLRAIRAGDPNSPIKLMAMIGLMDRMVPLCERYGAYLHDTGMASGTWAPMNGARLSAAHGLPYSAEQSGVPPSARSLANSITRYLAMPLDAADLVFSIKHYNKDRNRREWMEANAPLLRAVGKYSLPQPGVAILWPHRALRYGRQEPWNHDAGRGTLQALGRTFVDVEPADIADAAFIDRYKVVLDCGSVLMTDEEAEAVCAYVRRGGTFVCRPHTGRDSFARPGDEPLAKAAAKLEGDARGRFVRLDGPWHGDEQKAALDEILATAGVSRESRSNSFAQRMRSKNGLYDVYVCSIVQAPHSRAIASNEVLQLESAFARSSEPEWVRDFGAEGAPVVEGARWEDGWLKMPDFEFAGSLGTRLCVAPVEDPGGAGLEWLRLQSALWRPVETCEPPAPVAPDSDFLMLDGGWELEVDGETRVVDKPSPFAQLGLPDETVATFRKRVELPEGWKGRRIRFAFHCEGWFWGILPKGMLTVNGKPAPVKQPIGPMGSGQFSFELEPGTETLDIELVVDGASYIDERYAHKVPYGVTGVFCLLRLPEFIRTIPLQGTFHASFGSDGEAPEDTKAKKYLYRKFEFATPDLGGGRAWIVPRSGKLPGLVLNDWCVDARSPIPAALDVTRMLAPRGGTNILYWTQSLESIQMTDRTSPVWKDVDLGITAPAKR